MVRMAAPVADDRRAIAGIHPACSTNEPLALAPLADIQWGIHEDLDEAVLPDHVTHLVACRTVRTHRGGHHYSAVPDDLRSDEADAPDIGVPILFAEPHALPAAPSPRGPTRRPPPRS